MAIAGLLEVSKHNKDECKALHKVVTNIGGFLKELPCSRISQQVEAVLRKYLTGVLTSSVISSPGCFRRLKSLNCIELISI
jgi:hypothetical protein